jgi:hypothetical protein
MLPTGSWTGLNAYKAVPGLRTICEPYGIDLRDEPTEEEIQGKLFALMGKGKVYGAEERKVDEMMLYQSKYLNIIDGLLQRILIRSVHGQFGPHGAVNVLLTAGTVNWELRRVLELMFNSLGSAGFTAMLEVQSSRWIDSSMAQLFAELLRQGGYGSVRPLPEIGKIYGLGGPRLTKDAAGAPNPYISWFKELIGLEPSELHSLTLIYRDLFSKRFDGITTGSDNLDDLVVKFATDHTELAGSCIYVPLNAAAADKAVQIRGKLREVWGSQFDGDADSPQFYFSVDGFRVARNPEDAKNPARWQRPLTFASAIPRYVNMFHQLSQTG